MLFAQSIHDIFHQITVGRYYVSALLTQIFRGMFLHWMATILLLVTSNADLYQFPVGINFFTLDFIV